MFREMILRFADRMEAQAHDLWEVCLTLDAEGHPLADQHAVDARRYAMAAGYLRSRAGRKDRVSE
jgi:hypothetical protein